MWEGQAAETEGFWKGLTAGMWEGLTAERGTNSWERV